VNGARQKATSTSLADDDQEAGVVDRVELDEVVVGGVRQIHVGAGVPGIQLVTDQGVLACACALESSGAAASRVFTGPGDWQGAAGDVGVRVRACVAVSVGVRRTLSRGAVSSREISWACRPP
jgi:hypothetical protein